MILFKDYWASWVVEGQAWSIRDWLRQIQWSKYKGLRRCAAMTAAAHELARAGQAEAACAQLSQNLKSIHQCVLQQGSWETAWLLTGVADPCSKREFGGSKEEMAIVSQYISSLSKLRKRVKETQCRRRRRRRRRKGFKVKQPSRGFLHEEGPTTLDPAGSGDTRNSKFLAYYSWLRSARGALLDGSSVFKSLFPCHLPYPEGVPTIGSVGQAVPQLLYCLV